MPDNLRSLDITEILNEVADKGLVGESTIPRTVPTGKYTLRYQSVSFYEDTSVDPAIPFLNVNVIMEQDNQRKGSGFLKCTWKKERNPSTNKLTRRAQLYGQLLKALDLPEDTPVSKVGDAFQGQLVGAFITEGLRSPDSQFVQIGDEMRERDGQTVEITRERANQLIGEGWIPYNSFVNVFKIK